MKYLVTGLILLLARTAGAQYEVNQFRHYTTRDGLSNGYISGISQDSSGYIWIGTQRGLNRFDGYSFKTFLESSPHHSIPDNSIYSQRFLPGNELAIATSDGAQLITAGSLHSTILQVPTENSLRYWSNATMDVARDADGNYGVSTKTGFYIFSPTGKLKNRYDYYSVKDIGRAWMLFGRRIYFLPDGNLLQDNSAGFLVYDRKKNSFSDVTSEYIGLKNISSLISKLRYKFFFISPDHVLLMNNNQNSLDLIDVRSGSAVSVPACFNLTEEIGWQSQLNPVNDSTWTINSRRTGFFLIRINGKAKTISCDAKRYLEKYSCNVIFSDRDHRLWVGTNDGLLVQNLGQQEINKYAVDLKTDDNDAISSMYIGKQKIFVSTTTQKIFILDKNSKKVLGKVSFQSEATDFINSFLLVHPDTLWVGTFSGLKWLNTKNYSAGTVSTPQKLINKNTQILHLFKDREKNIWITSNDINRIISFHPGNGQYSLINDTNNSLLKINLPNSLAEDYSGNIWLGGDAVARWNNVYQRIDSLIEELPNQRKRRKGFQVMNNINGDIWLALNDNGVAKLLGPDSLLQFESEAVAPDPATRVNASMMQDKIFVRSNQGIGMLNTQSLKSILFNQADGVPETPITTRNFVFDSSDNSVWFASNRTLYRIPAVEQLHFRSAPVLHINQVSVNDSLINLPPAGLRLNYNQNDIRISLSTVNYTDPENMRFAFRFKNARDTSWSEIGTQQDILLSNISPGKYSLQFRLRAFDNKWPEQVREIKMTIVPPFWRTPWFIACIAIIISTSLYGAYLLRIRYIRRRTSIDKHLAELEMKALHAQMNPHFIFNALNCIQDMVLDDDKKNASRYLSRFAQLIRLNLEHSKRTFITLRENIEYLHYYLTMEQMRFEDLQFTIITDPTIDTNEACLPPMLIQPLVENAIWHGLLLKEGEKKLQIRFSQKSDVLICEIEDNGIGLRSALSQQNPHPHNAVGIRNINQRIEVLNQKYKIHYQLNIKDKEDMPQSIDSGTIAVLKLPLHEMFS